MEPEYSKQKLENLVMEIISFLQKWGLWQETTIFANGNRYAHTYEKEKKYKGLSFVEFVTDVNPETYTRGITASCDCDGQHIWKSFSNPEHIFDMVFEGPLYMLLRYGKYEVKKSDVSEEAWTYIFEHTDILEEYFLEKYGVLDEEGLLEQILMGQFEKSEYFAWNPLVFDTWEEYLAFCGDEESVVNYHRCDTSLKGSEDLEMHADIGVEDIMPLWERMVCDAKREYIRDCSHDGDERLYLPELADYIQSEFISIFSSYGLWYDFGFGWSLTCYRKMK